MKEQMKKNLVEWLRRQAANENEMIAFNNEMLRSNSNFKPPVSNEAHTTQAARLLEWADAVEES